MATQEQTGKAQIFISYAWEYRDLAEQLEGELTDSGAAPWVDYSKARVGDNLPDRISKGLEWCNTLVLLWSKEAKESDWVHLEWTSAIALKKKIVPCILDNTSLPGILANSVYLDFHDIDKGIQELWPVLNLVKKSKSPEKSKLSKPIKLSESSEQDKPFESKVVTYLPEAMNPTTYFLEQVVWSMHGTFAR